MTYDTHLKQQLDHSCDLLSPELQQKLHARTNLAKSQARAKKTRFSYALAPIALVLTLWFSIMQEQGLSDEEQALYDDIELLLVQDELGFLEDMDVSSWMIEEQTSTDA